MSRNFCFFTLFILRNRKANNYIELMLHRRPVTECLFLHTTYDRSTPVKSGLWLEKEVVDLLHKQNKWIVFGGYCLWLLLR